MATTTNFGWETPDDTDLVKDGALAMRTLGNAIDTSLVDLKGGTTGQVLSKTSNTDMDFTWVTSDDANAIQNAIVDAKGDLITATAADTPARLAVGTNGQVLTADSTTATGLKWAAATGGGKVLQVVQGTTSTSKQVASTTFTDSNLTATITPSASTSKILVLVTQSLYIYTQGTKLAAGIKLLRGATEVFTTNDGESAGTINGANEQIHYVDLHYLDSPATTSATTYKTQIAVKTTANNDTVTAQNNSITSSIILLEIGV